MIMHPLLRKSLLSVHVLASVGWAGALTVFLAHAMAAWSSTDAEIIRAASLAMAASAWLVILPLSLLSFATGVVQAIASPWGLVRHYWVTFKLVLTVIATVVLLLKLEPISQLAVATAREPFADPGLRTSLLLHAVGGLVILVMAAILGFFKPAGVIHWARQGRPGQPAPGPAGEENAQGRTPAWVKLVGAVVAIFFLLVIFMIGIGRHGPGLHA